MIRNGEVVKRHKVGMVAGDSWFKVVNMYSGYVYGHVTGKTARSALLAARRLFSSYDSTVVVYTGRTILPAINNEKVLLSFDKGVNTTVQFTRDTAINTIRVVQKLPEVQLSGIWVALAGMDNRIARLVISECGKDNSSVRISYLPLDKTYGFWQIVDKHGKLGKLEILPSHEIFLS